MQGAPRLFLTHPGWHRRQIVLCHQLGNFLFRIFRKTDIAIGQNANQLARLLHNRNAGDPVLLHRRLRFCQRRIRCDRDRIDHHAGFKSLYLAHRSCLLGNGEVAVQNANAAHLRHDDRHVRLRHRIHGRREDRNIQADELRQSGFRIGLARHDLGRGGPQQDIIESESQPNFFMLAWPAHDRHFPIA